MAFTAGRGALEVIGGERAQGDGKQLTLLAGDAAFVRSANAGRF